MYTYVYIYIYIYMHTTIQTPAKGLEVKVCSCLLLGMITIKPVQKLLILGVQPPCRSFMCDTMLSRFILIQPVLSSCDAFKPQEIDLK